MEQKYALNKIMNKKKTKFLPKLYFAKNKYQTSKERELVERFCS